LEGLAGSQRLRSLPYDSPGAMDLHPELDLARVQRSVQLILENGYLCEGAEAACNALALMPGLRALKFLYYLPFCRQLADFSYFLIARQRKNCPHCP
jgi:predicted DCC family thiol-disulfide oxidoreductase YuxK